MRKEKRNLAITEIFMILIAVIWFIPIYYLIVTTLKSSQEATANPLGLPKVLRLDNYVNAWVNMEFPRAFGNTLFITATAVLLIVIFGSMAGYALARTKSKIDVAINTPQAVFLFKEFIESTIPKELEEAAAIDGCSVFKRFFLIVLPLLKPVISTVVIIVTLNVWNEFMTPLLFLQSRENDVILQEVTRNIGQFATDWTALFPMLMLGVAPLMIFYVFMQKYIIAGVAAGAVKG